MAAVAADELAAADDVEGDFRRVTGGDVDLGPVLDLAQRGGDLADALEGHAAGAVADAGRGVDVG